MSDRASTTSKMSTSTSTTSKMITLTSSDGLLFEVQETVAKQSKKISKMIEDLGTDKSFIPLMDVTGSILEKVIEYMEAAERHRNWEKHFFADKPADIVLKLIDAAKAKNQDINELKDAAFKNAGDRLVVIAGEGEGEGEGAGAGDNTGELRIGFKDKLSPNDKEEEEEEEEDY